MSNGTTLYTDGNADFTNGSAAILGHSTLWTNLVDGDTLLAPDGKWYELVITDDTHATLDRNYGGTTASAQLTTIFKNSTARDSVRTATKQLSSVSATYGTLLSATGPNQTLKLNKATSADSAGITFRHFADATDTFQVGSFGDDNYSIKYQLASVWTKAFDLNSTTGAVSLMSQFLLGGTISPVQITVDTTDYAPAGLAQASVLLINSDATRILSGLTGGANGRVVALINNGAQQITLASEGTASVAANRFKFVADIPLLPGSGIMMVYDGASSRWRGISSTGSGAGTAGWSPIFGVYTDTLRHVLQIVDWTGGAGVKPATGSFVGASGLVSTPAAAANITATSTAIDAATLLGSSNPTAPSVSLFNCNDLSTQNHYSTGAGTTAASYRLQLIQNRAGLISQTIQNSANSNFPPAINATGWIRAGGEGDQVFGLFGQAIAEVAGGASHELDAYNNSTQDAPLTVPRGDSFGTTSVWTTALTLASGTTTGKNNWAALYIVQDLSLGNGKFNYGIYYHPTAVKAVGLYLDADATHSPGTSLLIKNTGQSTNILFDMQTTGNEVLNNPIIRHTPQLTSAGAAWSGTASFQVTQQGGIFSNQNTTLAAVPATLQACNFYGISPDGSNAVALLETYSNAGVFQGQLEFRTARGTGGSPSNVATGDVIGGLTAKAFCAGTFTGQLAASIMFVYTDPTPATWNGTAITFGTTPNGSFTRGEAGRFSASGGFSVGTTGDLGAGTILANTSITAPIHSGGFLASSTLILESTAAAGTSDAIIGKTGSQVERFRVTTDGFFNIGPNVAPDALLTINANTAATVGPPSGVNLHIIGADASPNEIVLDSYGSVGAILGRTSGGSQGSKSAPVANAQLLNVGATGWDGSVYGSAAGIVLFAANGFSGTDHSGYIAFKTTAIGSTTYQENMRLHGSGGLAVGNSIVGTDPGAGNHSVSGVYKVGANQVVGAHVTGYTAMTGTADKASAFAITSVTLAQLAARVAQLQADLTTHGLIGP